MKTKLLLVLLFAAIFTACEKTEMIDSEIQKPSEGKCQMTYIYEPDTSLCQVNYFNIHEYDPVEQKTKSLLRLEKIELLPKNLKQGSVYEIQGYIQIQNENNAYFIGYYTMFEIDLGETERTIYIQKYINHIDKFYKL